MVRIDHRIVITGILSLTIIFICQLWMDPNNDTLSTVIVGMIGLVIGAILPAPRIDHKNGVLIW